MLCKKCKKQFVGDTSLCPTCEKKEMYRSARNCVIKSVHDINKYLYLSLVCFSSVIILMIALCFVVTFLSFIWIMVIIGEIIRIIYAWREIRIWKLYKSLLDANKIDNIIEELVKRPKGLYRLCLTGDYSLTKVNRSLGFMGSFIWCRFVDLEKNTSIFEQLCTEKIY